ncbi:MAG: HNH endonuclease signature motif containing protein [Pseudomonadota bacterium]
MGKPLSPERRAQRFWEKVEKTDTCWIWTGTKLQHGYGALDTRRHGKRIVIRAHRFAWELTYGPIPEGLHVLHECDNPSCVRPEHLHLGTHAQNMAEMAARGRAGREFRKPNTKLSYAQVLEIRASKAPGVALAKAYGVSQQTICDIRKGRTRAKAPRQKQ